MVPIICTIIVAAWFGYFLGHSLGYGKGTREERNRWVRIFSGDQEVGR